MRQIVQNYKTGELKIIEVPAPLLKRGGAIIRTLFSVISAGTERSTLEISKRSIIGKAKARPDLVRKVMTAARKIGIRETFELVMNRLNMPVPLGYSLSGIIEEVGDEAEGISAGDLVACAGAGYANHAEIVYVPKNLVVKVPQGVSEKEAAFTTLGSIALHAVRQANVGVGGCVGIIGLGLIGQIIALLLKAQGSRVVGIDVHEYPVAFSKKMGVEVALLRQNPLSIEITRDFSKERGLDAVIVAAATESNDPFEFAAEILRDKGTLVVVGGIKMEIAKSISSPFYQKEIDIKFSRSYGPGRYDPNYEERGIDYPVGYVRWTEKRNMECFLELLASKRLDLNPLITHIFPLEKAIQAYQLIERKSEQPYLGVLLEFHRDARKEPPRLLINPKLEPHHGSIGVGMIGAGNFVQSSVLPHLKKNSDVILRGISTSRGFTARDVARKFGFSYCTDSISEILDDPQIHVVFIGTRHDSHARYVMEAINKGKNVFVEKPLCLDESELAEIVEAYRTAKKENHPSLMVGYNRRFAALSCKLKDLFGEPVMPITIIYRVNAGYLPPNNWYQDPTQGGRFVGEGCHFIDYGQFLTNSRPVQVNSFGIPTPGQANNLNDNLAVSIQMENGSLLVVIYNSSGDSTMPKERIEVFGRSTSAVLDDFKSLKIYKGGKSKITESWTQDKGHRRGIDSYLKSIKKGGFPPISFESLVATSLTTFAAMESLKKKTVTEIKQL